VRALLLAALLLLPGCGAARNRLVVYSAHGRDILREFEEAFERAHPDVDVVSVYDGSRNLLARLRAEKSNPQASVWWGGDVAALEIAGREGLLQEYTPSFAESGVARDPGGRWTACFDLPVALGWNPAQIAEAELPRTLDELAHPRYRGRLILRSPSGSGTMAVILAWIVARGRQLGHGDGGFDLLRRIDANVANYEASPDLLFERLEQGPAALTIWNLTDLVFQREEKGYSFKPAGFAEPVPVFQDGIALVRGPGAGAAAQAFFEFVNGIEPLSDLARRHARIPARPDFPRERLSAGVRAVPYEPFQFPGDFDAAAREAVLLRFVEGIQGRSR
jgi:iron(III) transport system substrate-binding protein